MPTISMFYGIVVMLFYYDNKQHNLPHIHVRYQDSKAIFDIENAEMIEGNLPNKQKRLVQAWMEIHKDELIADWELAISGEQPYKIDPLK
ncbi:MAG: DUF4160 domain-containing protein [Sulfurimonas sp.]|uniref:type II toxin-antitoxin system toxin DhiT n=1 Tax=Sulfurimonas sp. TaxID=2022749 RepID=UPI0026233992|nr:DUF4160 domain-containing protein [Sulfurimonas sp.]MDD5373050.1 DUF4160 domain-containing protein [Sulfurimonas sp.]MDD5400863.1 DUF4160 domain-containing protein [Sulfurimonas sp.]